MNARAEFVGHVDVKCVHSGALGWAQPFTHPNESEQATVGLMKLAHAPSAERVSGALWDGCFVDTLCAEVTTFGF